MPFDEIAIPCPQCGKNIKKGIRRLGAKPNIRCPKCGVSIKVEGGAKLNKVGKTLAQTGKILNRAFKPLKKRQ